MPRLVFAALVALALATGVAAASVLVPVAGGTEHDHPHPGPEPAADDVEPGSGARQVHWLAADPDGGPGWGVRVYRSTSGRTCPNAGRVAGGRFGRAGGDGALEELPEAADGACADLDRQPQALVVRRYPARAGQPGRGVVFGVASSRVTDVRLRCPDRDERLDLSHDGAFLAVDDDPLLTGCELTVVTAGGGSERYPLDR